MDPRIINTGSGWPETTRDATFDDIFRVGQLLAGADGVVETFEAVDLAGKTNFCREHGFARVYTVNNGAPVGAILITIDQANKTRAAITAHFSIWGERSRNELLIDAKTWAKEKNVTLGEIRRVTKTVIVEEWAELP